MNVRKMMRIDRWVGVPACAVASAWRWLTSPFQRKADAPVRSIAFIKLAEQGSTVLAQTALLDATRRVGRENVYMVVFDDNRFIVDVLDVIPVENVITVRSGSMLAMIPSALAALLRLRRLRLGAVIDLEFFARFSALLAFLSGAAVRVGFHAFFGEGPYRGDLMTHRIRYNPHLHTTQTFAMLVAALDEPVENFPRFDLVPMRPEDAPVCFAPQAGEAEEMERILIELTGEERVPRLILLNANASDLLPLRRWDPERYIELGRRLLAELPEAWVAFTGAVEDAPGIDQLVAKVGHERCFSLAGKTTLRQLMVLYTLADVLVTNDSGPAHFASLTPIRTVTLFGPETPLLFAALTPRNKPLWAGIACSPCVSAVNNRQSACTNNVCMQRISIEQVYDAVLASYRERSVAPSASASSPRPARRPAVTSASPPSTGGHAASSPAVSSQNPQLAGSASSPARNPWWRAGVAVLCGVLFAMAAWYFLWPVYRAFLNVEIDGNEGWNAYLADAALGRMPLYPSPDKLITNNYPPLSYYIVGGVGKLLGDPLLAGRLISLVAVLGIGVAIAVGIRSLGGDRAGAGIGAATFIITITHFCHHYVGMDDPQLLAQAIMAAGFVGFLRAEGSGRSCLGPILLMGLAGFVKHNIIAMPVTAFLWLAFSRPREAVKCALIAGAATALGFGVCFLLYGHDFFSNMLIARQTFWARSFHYAGDLRCVNVALAITVLLGCIQWRDRGPRICLLLSLVGLGTAFLQRSGMGVDKNAIFDLMIGVSFGTGLAFSYARRVPEWGVLSGGVLQAAILLALCVRVYPTNLHRDRTYRLLFDPSFQTEITIREQVTEEAIAKVRSTPGPVMSSTFVCYRSGKPFAVDKFNVTQRMATGALPPKTLRSLLVSGQLTEVRPDLLADWENPVDGYPVP